ncbi:MAG: MFS transporter, partial [Mycobacteriaceae bacterium]|nr:MFS transporter [Mycobacteriaceae bacterium]
MALNAPTARLANPWLTLAMVATTTFMLMLHLVTVYMALPAIGREWDGDFPAQQAVLLTYALGLIATLSAGGMLADRIGYRRAYDVGMLVHIVGSMAAGLAASESMLFAALVVQGLGGGVMLTVGPTLLGNTFRGKERGAAFTAYGVALGMALALGSVIGGGLTDSPLGWRAIFLINVPIAAVFLFIGVIAIDDELPRATSTAPPVDWAGAALLTGGSALAVYAILRAERHPWSDQVVVGCLAVAAMLLAGFVAVQTVRPQRSLIDPAVLRNRSFAGLSLVSFLWGAVALPVQFLHTAYAQNIMGWSAWEAGIRFLPMMLVGFVSAALTGGLIPKLPPAVILAVSQLFLAVGCYQILQYQPDMPYSTMVVAQVCMGLCIGVYSSGRAAYAMAANTSRSTATLYGANMTIEQVGAVFGIALVGWVFRDRVVDFANAVAILAGKGDAVAAAGAPAPGIPT